MDKFDVKFVPFGKDGVAFAKALKTEMNRVVKNGYSIIRSEQVSDGYLIIAHKTQVSRQDMKSASIYDLLRDQIARGVATLPIGLPSDAMSGGDVLSPESNNLLDAFFGANYERIGNKKAIIDKIGETLPPVLRRYPSAKLRPILENISRFIADHEKSHPTGKACELTEILKAVVEAGNKHMQQNAC